jgi:FAD:protein FMN transferase
LALSRSKKALVVPAAGAFLFLVFVYFQAGRTRIYTAEGATMGTTWSVQVSAANFPNANALHAELNELLHTLDVEIFSTWTPNSELSLLNASPPDREIPVSPALMTVLSMSKTLHAETNQAFDITIGPLVNLWGFGPQPVPAQLPDAAAVEQQLHQLGMQDLMLDQADSTVLKHKALTLDLSAIAKGYAVDVVADLLIQKGYQSFIVEIGGEIRTQGLRPDHKPWVIAIESPVVGSRVPYDAIANYGEPIAVAGSGDYRNFRDINGTVYSHEIDPRTGYPIAHNLAAVTVIADSAARADAWATALMVLGAEEGRALADSENVAAYFIMRDGTALEHTHTAAFTRFLYQGKESEHGSKQF